MAGSRAQRQEPYASVLHIKPGRRAASASSPHARAAMIELRRPYQMPVPSSSARPTACEGGHLRPSHAASEGGAAAPCSQMRPSTRRAAGTT
eukprot:2885559-Prymnesium_polylepis.1